MKKGEVCSWSFDREWLASCDEAERMLMYRSSYRTFQMMKNLMPVMEGAALFGKIFMGTGNFPIVLVSLIWAAQTGSYCYFCGRLGKRGLSR